MNSTVYSMIKAQLEPLASIKFSANDMLAIHYRMYTRMAIKSV